MSPFLPPKVSIPIPAAPLPAKERPQIPSTRLSSGDTHRSSSISSWVKQMLPSHRPERRGTLRRRGFWEQQESIHPSPEGPRRSATGRRSRRSATVGSNHITEWNMARNLSDYGSVPPNCEASSAMEDRTWSWVPGDDDKRPQQKAVDKNQRQGPLGVSGNRINIADMESSGSQSLSTVDLRFIEEKKESRRLRRNLKESGDYLGVQGFNPETGRLDVVTPTESDRSSGLSQETQRKLLILQNTLKNARHSYKSTVQQSEREAKKILLKSEKEKLRRLEKEKEEVKDTNKAVKWKRHTRQWSSAQEPDLSPIAQSVIETDDVSRRESQHLDLKQDRGNSTSSLIDLGSSELPIAASMLQGDQHLGQSPDSTATVVRTPHRQSLADLAEIGPAAWELFANGISFDSSDEPMSTQEVQPKLENTDEADSRCVESAEMPVSNSKRDDGYSTQPPYNGKAPKEPIRNTEQMFKATFLDMRRERQEDPRGQTVVNSWERSTNKHTKRHTLPHAMGFDRMSKSHRQRRHFHPGQVEPTAVSHNNAREALSNTMTVSQAFRNCRPGVIPPPEEKSARNGGPRKPLMRTWGQWISRRRSSRSSGSSQGDIVHTEPLYQSRAALSVTNLGTVPRIPDDWAAGLTSRLGQQVAAHRSEVVLRTPADHMALRLEAKTSQKPYLLAPIAEKSNGKPNSSLSRGKDGTTEMTNGFANLPVQTRHAYTPTTTTTGYDQQRLQVPQANIRRETERTRPLGSKYRPDTATYDLPLTTRSERNLGVSAVKILPNPLPSEGHTRHDIETDITSKQQPMAMNQRVKRKTIPFEKGATALVSTEAAPKTMSWTEPGARNAGLWDHWDVADQRVLKVSKATTTSTSTLDRPSADNRQNETAHRERVERTTLPEEPARVKAIVVDELSDLPQCPGSFPCPGIGGDNGDGCQSSSSDSLTGDGISRVTGKEYLEMVGCHLLALVLLYWKMYWKTVAPVFQTKSEYWKRNERHESTLEDCFTLLLALPGLLVLLAGSV